MNEEILSWINSEEGKSLYRDWMKKLCLRAEIQTGVKINLSENDELELLVEIEERDLPPFIKNQRDELNCNNVVFKTQYIIKNIIITHLLKLASGRRNKPETDFKLSRVQLFELIENTLVKDICQKVQDVKKNTIVAIWEEQRKIDLEQNKKD